MSIESTGSTVEGAVVGLVDGLGMADLMFCVGDPNNIVAVPDSALGATSGGVVAYDQTNNQFYQHIGGASGATWQKLGSVA